MAEHQDQSQRTEEPTPKRLADAQRKGDAPKSQEVIAAGMLAAGALVLWLFAGPAARGVLIAGMSFLERPHDYLADGAALQRLFAGVALRLCGALGGAAALALGAALIVNVAQARPVFTLERIRPSLQKLSPIAGAKRIFGPSGLFNFAKGVVKIIIVAAVLGFALWPDRALLATALYADAATLLQLMRILILKLVGLTLAALTVIAALDYAFQRHSWRQRLRMTKEEARREMKETEGDPQVKSRLRRLRDARARKRTLAAVKDATVLIANPTHYAVALDYKTDGEGAPRCVAKGVDDLAMRMRAVAEENSVPTVENPPLARALHASVDIDDEIPIEHYEAVAKVIGFIMRKAAAAPPAP